MTVAVLDLNLRMRARLTPDESARVLELLDCFATALPLLEFPLSEDSALCLATADWAVELEGLIRKGTGVGLAEYVNTTVPRKDA